MVNTLFTSIGRRVELVHAFRKAYESLGLAGKIIGVDVDPLAPALQVTDKRYIVPRVTSPEYIPALLRICEAEQIGLIFPLIDPDIPVLARSRDVFKRIGIELAVVPIKAADVVEDKWLTRTFFRDLGLQTPDSWLPNDLNSDLFQLPLFIKPRRGSAGKNAFRVDTKEQLEFFIQHIDQPIIQQLICGPEITNDVIVDLQGNVLAVVSRQRLEVRSGEVSKGVTVYDAAITEACVRIAESLPAVGPITVQCLMLDGRPYFTEINARMGGGLPLALAAGVDVPKWLLARFIGIPVDIPPLGTYQRNLYMSRCDETLFLEKCDLEQIQSNHIRP